MSKITQKYTVIMNKTIYVSELGPLNIEHSLVNKHIKITEK